MIKLTSEIKLWHLIWDGRTEQLSMQLYTVKNNYVSIFWGIVIVSIALNIKEKEKKNSHLNKQKTLNMLMQQIMEL